MLTVSQTCSTWGNNRHGKIAQIKRHLFFFRFWRIMRKEMEIIIFDQKKFYLSCFQGVFVPKSLFCVGNFQQIRKSRQSPRFGGMRKSVLTCWGFIHTGVKFTFFSIDTFSICDAQRKTQQKHIKYNVVSLDTTETTTVLFVILLKTHWRYRPTQIQT